jgi:opacity protein-like surface antigen
LPGFTIGFAPQAIFNVKAKEDTNPASNEYDLFARVAYTQPLVETIAVYAEFLPGYSLIVPSDGDTAKGLVVALGAGVSMDVTPRIFANLGVGYQAGFQKLPPMDQSQDVRTKYVRVALGGGWRF